MRYRTGLTFGELIAAFLDVLEVVFMILAPDLGQGLPLKVVQLNFSDDQLISIPKLEWCNFEP